MSSEITKKRVVVTGLGLVSPLVDPLVDPVRRLLDARPVSRALYAGDDTTDLDAFRGLEEAGLEVALKVSVASPEMNPALLTRADLVVDGPGELLGLLKTL